MSMIGKSLIHYEVTSEIGKGGMGEVYQAKDTKLGRDVAIKVLPEEFALDTDRVARFQREAKLLASLNHPNIAAIHGLEESEGIHFLVMELIEGDTLKDKIKSGPIPVEEALKLALQMAEALEAAHEKGVIHRDLKPANIKVTPDGKVKILDFGLAKAYAGDQENLSPMDSPTISAAATQQGVILGTAAYMSPEQAKGKSVDKRADIWAFGVVLFEMLTGRQLFTGETASETLASVMKSEPEWDSLPPNLHSRIRLLLERCLEKDPKNRYSGISDARVDIQQVLADPSGIFSLSVTTTESGARTRTLLLCIAAIFLTTIIAGVIGWNLKTSEPRSVIQFDYHLPEGQQLSRHALIHLAVSTDGSQFVYITDNGLYLRSVNQLEARPIAGTDENPQAPFFSPDGQWIGYYSIDEQQLKKIAISGGAPVTICESSWVAGARWHKDNAIVFSDVYDGIKSVSADGGTPEMLVEAKGTIPILPELLPDGKSIMFTLFQPAPARIVVQSLETGERKELFAGMMARYLPTGHLVYRLNNNLLAVPFDLDTLEATGGPVTLVEDDASHAISDSGTLVYILGTGATAGPGEILVWVDREAKEEPLATLPSDYNDHRISPNGAKVAFVDIISGNQDIWVWDFVRETKTRLTFDETADTDPIWTPDNKMIIFASNRDGHSAIYWKAADGTGDVAQLVSTQGQPLYPSSLTSDGETLLIRERGNLNDIGMLSMEGDRERKTLLQEQYNETTPQVSPDGRWMAYTSDETGNDEIYVRPFPDVESGGRWQVSTSGGEFPLWSPDGKELYYRGSDAIMAVSVKADPTFKLDAPRILLTGEYYSDWDIHPNGERFLMVKQPQPFGAESTAENPRKITIVLNWFEELKERVPVD